jgi:uncharacterized protein YhaN
VRFQKLYLSRFGHFDGTVIDFGARQGPEVHVVYGPNEAGKTTVLNAVLRLLYGYPRKGVERYDFRHGANLEVGAVIELQGRTEPVEVCRVKTGNALLDARGGRLPDDLFAADLAGLEEEAYRRIFSHERVYRAERQARISPAGSSRFTR